MNAVDTALTGKGAVKLISGNHACALGAVAAGCRFFAGYPITPSSEIAERLSRRLPEVGGVFVQMEDEIASMAAVIGASMGGVKAMTATSGPGFSLKQENLGYAAGAEIPCVIVNVMRGGPSTGMPTRPSQADVMQARWGSHGDYPIIVLAPASVAEIYSETIRAFELAEKCRSPVVLLYDQVIAQLSETVALNGAARPNAERTWASGPRADFKPYGGDDIPAMARPGDGYRVHTTGLTHSESGFPTQNPEAVTRNLSRLLTKLERHRDLIDSWETVACDDADVVIVAIGISARAARRAVEMCRAQGLRVGLFRPITLWPFPEEALREAAAGARAVLVPEMNNGQLRLEVERVLERYCRSRACICSAARRSRLRISPPAPRRWPRRRHDSRHRRRIRRARLSPPGDDAAFPLPRLRPRHRAARAAVGDPRSQDRQGQARGRLRHRLRRTAVRLYRRQHLPRDARPAAGLCDGPRAGASRSARRRHHRRRRLSGDRRQSSDPRLPAQSQADLPDAQQRGLRHDRRPGVADHLGDAADHHHAARQSGAAFRRLRAGRARPAPASSAAR